MKTFKKSFKIISLVLAFCMIASFLPVISFAEEENTTAFEITVNEDGSTCTVTGFKADSLPTADSYELTIPETIAGYSVTAIGNNAFRVGSSYVTYKAGAVTLPDTVKSIGNYAFKGCEKMTLESWPSSLETVGQFAFDNAKSGKISGDFSNTKLTTIEKQAFSNVAGSLTSVQLPDTLTTIGEKAFAWANLKAITFPNSVTSLGVNVLQTCYASLKTVRFPRNNAITAIPEGAVSSAYPKRTDRLFGSMSLYIPETITSIPDDLLKDFGDGKTVTIYGKYGSAACQFANDVNEALKNSEYANEASYGSGTEDDPYTDADGDGKGELAAVNFVEYDFDIDSEVNFDDSNIADGTNDLTLVSNQDGCSLTADTDGVFGKAASDKVYKLDVTGECHTGYNYLGGTGYTLDTSVFEFSFALTDGIKVDFAGSFYKTAEVNDKITVDDEQVENRISGTILTFDGENVKLGGSTPIAASARGTTLTSMSSNQWISAAVVVPGYSATGKAANEVYVYINGTKYTIPLEASVYGTRHLRLAPSGVLTDTKTVYYDNVRTYLGASETYIPAKDALPVVDFGAVDVTANTINADSLTTVSAFKAAISTDASVRIYEDDTYAAELSDSDKMANGNIVVFGTNNRRTTERAYSYYEVGEFVYEEPSLYEGTKDLSIVGGSGNDNPATVTEIEGKYGKTSDDYVYKIDMLGGHSGMNYINASGKTLDTTITEISFAFTDNSPQMIFSVSAYLSSDESKVTSDDSSNRVGGTVVKVAQSAVTIGDFTAINSSYRGQKLCDIKPGQWVSIAVVIPGYNALGAATDKYLVYVNGTEYEIPLATATYGTRHMRISAATTYAEEKTIYADNYRTYMASSETYSKAKDALPAVDLSAVDVLDGNINLANGTTVADFKDMIDTKATIRVYSDEDYTTLLSDSDEMSGGNMVVFAARNSRTTERTYSYYTVNRPLFVQNIKLTNVDGKVIRGSQTDIANVGETYYLEAEISNKATSTYASLKAIAASYDTSGKMVDFAEKSVSVAPGTTEFSSKSNAVAFEDVQTPKGGTLKAFLWLAENNEPLCDEFSTVFDGIEEYQILALGNSWANDAFRNLPAVAKANGIDIYAVNMYKSGCPLSKHYEAMVSGEKIYNRIEYTPDGNYTTETLGFDEILNTYGYSWDYITMQARATTGYDFDYFWTEENPYITDIADHLREEHPKSEVMMHEIWTVDTKSARDTTYDVRIDDVHINDYVENMGWTDEQIRPNLFAMIKNNFIMAAEKIGNPNRIIPAGEAINYAVGTLGIPEFVENGDLTDGKYENNAGTRAVYRDNAPHLTTYGSVLVALTWYEYITGNDATESLYTNADIPEEDMALLKQAAHWACTQADYNPAN